MRPHPLREMFANHSCKNCRYPERGCTRYMRINTCQEFQPNDDAIFREIVRLKIAHLRRMAKASADLVGSWPSVLASIPPEHEDANSWRARWIRKHMALQSACLAKITELKESQCSTKS